MSNTIIEKEITRFDIERNGVMYEVRLDKRSNDNDRPLCLTVTNKNNPKDSEFIVTRDPGILGSKKDYLPKFQEHFDKRILLHMRKEDGKDKISYVALSRVAQMPSQNFISINTSERMGSRDSSNGQNSMVVNR